MEKKKNNRIKVLGKRRRKSKINTGDFSGEGNTIFSSRNTLSSAEREAVKKGEKRGEAAVVAANPEKYGNIGSINPIRQGKSMSLIFRDCYRGKGRGRCKFFKGTKGSAGKHCSLPEDKRCVR